MVKVYNLDGKEVGELFTDEPTRFVTPEEYKKIVGGEYERNR